jgi:hypothetical protein
LSPIGFKYRRRDDDKGILILGWSILFQFSPLHELGFGWIERRGVMESLRKSKAIQCTCGVSAGSVLIVGLGLYSYYVRELLASIALFAGAFLLLGLVALGMFLVWCAMVKVAMWTPPASRSVIAISRRFIAAYAKP